MPYLIPPRTPLAPEQVEQGFDYLLALQTGGGAYAAGRTEATPELAFILLRLAEDIMWPVTAVDGETDPCADSFALDEVECVLLSALRDWARDSPTTAVPGIARSIIRFTVNVIPDPDHMDTAGTLAAMRRSGWRSWACSPLRRRLPPRWPRARRRSKAQAAFQRGLAALTQWVEREGDRPVPRGHSEQITANGEPVTVKLGVWISNTKSRGPLDAEQIAALAALGIDWARPVTVPQAVPDSL
ncbi:helicase associated domain-containing protein [Streptomyces olivaceoviridis]|uniref:helicase associated domain-containing protein n=1 Tax=Streptomyces olivaceoviridis TaxID=1921 RepID=UPI003D9F46FD